MCNSCIVLLLGNPGFNQKGMYTAGGAKRDMDNVQQGREKDRITRKQNQVTEEYQKLKQGGDRAVKE